MSEENLNPTPDAAAAPVEAKPKAKAKEAAPAVPAWLERLKAEAKDLAEKQSKLGEFLGSPVFGELPEIQKSLLKSQHTYQTLLLHVLEQRIENA